MTCPSSLLKDNEQLANVEKMWASKAAQDHFTGPSGDLLACSGWLRGVPRWVASGTVQTLRKLHCNLVEECVSGRCQHSLAWSRQSLAMSQE